MSQHALGAVKCQLLWADGIAAAVGGLAGGLRMVLRSALLGIEFGTVGTEFDSANSDIFWRLGKHRS